MIINISDHYTRVLQGSGADDGPSDGRRVLGALFGVQEGLTVDVLDSFELAYKKQGNDTVIDTEYITAKREQWPGRAAVPCNTLGKMSGW